MTARAKNTTPIRTHAKTSIIVLAYALLASLAARTEGRYTPPVETGARLFGGAGTGTAPQSPSGPKALAPPPRGVSHP